MQYGGLLPARLSQKMEEKKMEKKADKALIYGRPTLTRLDEGVEGQIRCADGTAAAGADCKSGATAAGYVCNIGGVPAG